MKKLKTITRREALKIALLVSIVMAIATPLCTGVINGLCLLWVGPALIMLEESHWDEWAKKKLEDKNDRWTE